MRLTWRVPLVPNSVTSQEAAPASTVVERITITWVVNMVGSNWVTDVDLIATGAEIHFTPSGAVSDDYPDYHDRLFRVLGSLADFVLIGTGQDALNPATVLALRPTVEPETPEEQRAVADAPPQAVGRASATGWAVVTAPFSPSAFAAHAAQVDAQASLASGLRAGDAFVKYREFYRVIEHFFLQEGPALDAAVSCHALQFDPSFDQATVKDLREIRIGLTHPHPRKARALSPLDRADRQLVADKLLRIEQLARLLLRHPPP